MHFFRQLNTKEDILKNVGNQAVAGSHSLPYMEVTIQIKLSSHYFSEEILI